MLRIKQIVNYPFKIIAKTVLLLMCMTSVVNLCKCIDNKPVAERYFRLVVKKNTGILIKYLFACIIILLIFVLY